MRLRQYLDISLQYSAQEVEALKAEYKETITNLKEERENATKMDLEQTVSICLYKDIPWHRVSVFKVYFFEN